MHMDTIARVLLTRAVCCSMAERQRQDCKHHAGHVFHDCNTSVMQAVHVHLVKGDPHI